MRLRPLVRRAAAALLGAAGLGAAGCQNDVNVTDPNASSTGTFGRTATDANASVVATYNALLRLGTFQRWIAFAYDLRSDIGTSRSPNPLIPALAAFSFPGGYNAEINSNLWNDSFTLVSRANTAIAFIPNADMDATLKAQYLGEAKFLRGLGYFHLVTVFGSNIPLITAPPAATDRPASSDSASIYNQIEQDLTDAVAGLPVQTIAQSGGRATKAAAQGLLGKVQLQQHKYAAAQASLAPIVNGQSGTFALEPNYARLFRQEGNLNPETLFEVQMGSPQTCVPGVGVCGLNIIKMIGPPGLGFTDGEPTRWFFNQFFQERTTTGGVDPRLDATIFYYKGDTTRVYARTWAGWRDTVNNNGYKPGTGATAADTAGQYRIFWKKYSEYYLGVNDQSWEAQINYKILRYADVLLMYAEALNEQGQPAQAVPFVNRVRNRAQLANYAGAVTQAAVRAEIERQRLLEFGLEAQRWLDLKRYNAFANLPVLQSHDKDFLTYKPGLEVFPIPSSEIILNPNLKQNPGY